jgi:hypothetical protein
VLCESVPGQVVVKACGSASERPPIKGCNDVAVDRFGQACRFLASFGLPFVLLEKLWEVISCSRNSRSIAPGGTPCNVSSAMWELQAPGQVAEAS